MALNDLHHISEEGTNVSNYIASLYSRGKALGSVQELKPFQSSDRILIIGNGPSIRTNDNVRDLLLDKNIDKSGTNAAAMLSSEITYLLFEPYFTLNSYEEPFMDPEGIAAYVTMRVLWAFVVKALNQKRGSVSNIIANPQFPPNELGYAESINTRDIYSMSMYLIRESDDQTLLDDLKGYVHRRQFHRTHILNVRGSVIRQLSLAFALQYEEIHLCGLDPSTRGYWYTDAVHNPHDKILGEIWSECADYCASLEKLLKVSSSEGCRVLTYSKSSQFEFTWSILFVARLYLRIYASLSKLVIHVTDPMVLSYCYSLGLDSHEGCELRISLDLHGHGGLDRR